MVGESGGLGEGLIEKGHLSEALEDGEEAPQTGEGRLFLRQGVPGRFADLPQGQRGEGM